MEEKPFEIDISTPQKEFEAHLNLFENYRILFSAPFGTGKTYFLDKFFKEDKYEAIHLFPVNYSVATNEDIFELIKFDLLFELLKKDLNFEAYEFSKLLTLQFFLSDNTLDIIKPIAENTSKIGKNVIAIIEPVLKINEKFKKFHREAQIDEKQQVVSYLKTFIKEKGSLYEEDVFTQIITSLLQQCKAKGKETILIIDDLDRIDPEHIFRLLNVFAAHFDINSQSNKFDFNRVVFVCDVNNVRNIFHAKYGLDVDFTGYIDKFYSKEIFKFDNKKMVEDTIGQILLSMKVNDAAEQFLKLNDARIIYYKDIKYLLSVMFKADAINLRSLRKIYRYKYCLPYYELQLGIKYNLRHNVTLVIVMILDFLKFLCGNGESLKQALKKCSQTKLSESYKDERDPNHYEKMGYIIPILAFAQHNFNIQFQKTQAFYHEKSGFTISYILKRGHIGSDSINGEINSIYLIGQPDLKIENINYFSFLLETLEILQSYNLIR